MALVTVRWRYSGVKMRGLNRGRGWEGEGTPLFSRDSVTNTVLPRFFSRSPVTLPVTCRDKSGGSVTSSGESGAQLEDFWEFQKPQKSEVNCKKVK